jgi:hypothetical protein
MTGMIVGAFGFGAFFFGFITKAIVNPNNAKTPNDFDEPPPHYYPKVVAERVPEMFQLCLVIWSTLCILSILSVSRNPEAKLQ